MGNEPQHILKHPHTLLKPNASPHLQASQTPQHLKTTHAPHISHSPHHLQQPQYSHIKHHVNNEEIALPKALHALANPPRTLFALGDVRLLDARLKIAIVGSRKPNTYAQTYTSLLARSLVNLGAVIISGGALGVDILAHAAALPSTICVLPTSLDTFYPASNHKILKNIANSALMLSEYPHNSTPKAHHFLHRNRIVVALSDVVIIPQADRQSGSLSSANVCSALQKPLFVLSHRIGESLGTQDLLATHRAQAITDIERFCAYITQTYLHAQHEAEQDDLLDFAKENHTFEEALARFGDRVLEYELLGKIMRVNGRIVLGQ